MDVSNHHLHHCSLSIKHGAVVKYESDQYANWASSLRVLDKYERLVNGQLFYDIILYVGVPFVYHMFYFLFFYGFVYDMHFRTILVSFSISFAFPPLPFWFS